MILEKDTEQYKYAHRVVTDTSAKFKCIHFDYTYYGLAWVNSADPDQGLQCWPFCLHLLEEFLQVSKNYHYMNVSVLINFSQKTSVFTLIIISSP